MSTSSSGAPPAALKRNAIGLPTVLMQGKYAPLVAIGWLLTEFAVR